MNNFTFYSPTLFAFGQEEASRVGALVRQFGGSKVLLVAGGGSVRKNKTKAEALYWKCPRPANRGHFHFLQAPAFFICMAARYCPAITFVLWHSPLRQKMHRNSRSIPSHKRHDRAAPNPPA